MDLYYTALASIGMKLDICISAQFGRQVQWEMFYSAQFWSKGLGAWYA